MVTIGVQDGTTQRAESKVTSASQSDPMAHDLVGGPTLSGRVSLCRIGDQLHLHAAPTGGGWELLRTFDATDVTIPDDAELGIAVNGFNDEDVRAVFDNFDVEPATDIADCTP